MPKVQPRDVSPLLQMLRNFLNGRKHTLALRFEESLSARTQPPPELPDGPCHGLSANYYYARDARREVKPPLDLVAQTLLEAGSKKGDVAAPALKGVTPGPVYKWDQHVYY